MGHRSSLAAKIMCVLSLSHTQPFTPVGKNDAKPCCSSLLCFCLPVTYVTGPVVVLKRHHNCVVSRINSRGLKKPLHAGKKKWKKKKKQCLSLDYFNDPEFSVALLPCISTRKRTCLMLSEMPWGLQYSHSRLVGVMWGLMDLRLCGMAAGGQAEYSCGLKRHWTHLSLGKLTLFKRRLPGECLSPADRFPKLHWLW